MKQDHGGVLTIDTEMKYSKNLHMRTLNFEG